MTGAVADLNCTDHKLTDQVQQDENFLEVSNNTMDEGIQTETSNSLSKEQLSLVTWDTPNDPENPMNWSKQRKWLVVVAASMTTFCVSFSSSIFSTAVSATAKEFQVGEEVMILGVSLYIVGFAIGMSSVIYSYEIDASRIRIELFLAKSLYPGGLFQESAIFRTFVILFIPKIV